MNNPDPSIRCEKCMFFQDLELENTGYCRRYPPTANIEDGGDRPAMAYKHCWCGEFRAKGRGLE